MKKVILINPLDNVAVALENLERGDNIKINRQYVELLDNIYLGNKFALTNINKGEDVIKYGYSIGKAKNDISKGALVHTHNVETKLVDKIFYQYNYTPINKDTLTIPNAKFNGYIRKDNKVGIRNEIWIIPMVGCVNAIARVIEERANKLIKNTNIDQIVAYPHQFGCSQLGEDHESFQVFLSGLAKNPNCAGVLFIALGCENNTIESFKQVLEDYDKDRILFIKCQDHQDEVDYGMSMITQLIENAKNAKREEVTVDKLVVGLKCGGSDGLSGITANPVIGAFSDILIKSGGTSILTEVPEMFGAEQILMNRCVDKEIFEKLVKIINEYKDYYITNNQPIYENPSPGNKEGGISTLEEKSLGCVLKGGNSDINNVIDYSSQKAKSGLNIMASPGNDLIASSALAAAGAQLVLFSTGRGTPFSTAVPTIKISSNTNLYTTKNKWIDFNAGEFTDYNSTIEEYGSKLFDYVLQVASGKRLKSEEYGTKEIAYFKRGVTL